MCEVDGVLTEAEGTVVRVSAVEWRVGTWGAKMMWR